MKSRLTIALIVVSAMPAFADLPPITATPLSESGGYVSSVAVGSDGAVWFLDSDKNLIGRTSRSGGGSVTTYPVPTANAGLRAITAGSDGNMWFIEADANKLGKVTTSGVITEYPIANLFSNAIAAAPDGNLWVYGVTPAKGVLAKFTTSGASAGTITLPGNPGNNVKLAPGPGNAMWFHDRGDNTVGYASPTGAVQSFAFKTPDTAGGFIDAGGLTAGPDGNMWVGHSTAIARVTPTGTITEYAVPGGSRITGVASGADGNIWFVDGGTAKIGRLIISTAKNDGTATIDQGSSQFRSPSGIYPIAPQSGSSKLRSNDLFQCPAGEFLVYDSSTPPPHVYLVQLPATPCADLALGASVAPQTRSRVFILSLTFFSNGPDPSRPTITGALSILGGDLIGATYVYQGAETECSVARDTFTCEGPQAIPGGANGKVVLKVLVAPGNTGVLSVKGSGRIGGSIPDPVAKNNDAAFTSNVLATILSIAVGSDLGALKPLPRRGFEPAP